MVYSRYINTLILLNAVLFSTNVGAANEFQQSLKNSTTSVNLRAAYIRSNPDVAGNKTTSAAAFAGQLKAETADWDRLQFALAAYFVEKIEPLSGDETQGELNSDFFDSNNDSYAYLGEAYVNYKSGNTNLRFGRQQLDNPFINTDDIRMHPNTFDALWVTYTFSNTLNFEAGKVQRWAGFDSGNSQDKFKNASNDGVTALGASYQMKLHHLFQFWVYDFNKRYRQFYFDATYTNGNFEAGVQYSQYNEDNASAIDGSVYGLSVAYTFDKLILSTAINESSNDAGKSVDNGLGGGSFYTSMDDTTIAGITDVSSYVLTTEYEFFKDFSTSIAYGHFEDGSGLATNIDETKLVLTYEFEKNIDIEFIYTDVENSADTNDAATNFSRQLARINYNF